MPKLVGSEQCGFIDGCNLLGNILIIREVTHSIEQDFKAPPRMIVKIDVGKGYDTLRWDAILATMLKMGFHPSWIFGFTHVFPWLGMLVSLMVNQLIGLDPIGVSIRGTICLLISSF